MLEYETAVKPSSIILLRTETNADNEDRILDKTPLWVKHFAPNATRSSIPNKISLALRQISSSKPSKQMHKAMPKISDQKTEASMVTKVGYVNVYGRGYKNVGQQVNSHYVPVNESLRLLHSYWI